MFLKVNNIFAYEVLDSRGNPTIACIAKVSSGIFTRSFYSAKAIVPSGASTGSREVIELRDNDKSRYLGKGVKKAVHYINYVIAPSLIENSVNPEKQAEFDQFLIDLDGTEDKSRYGGNAILAVSLAVAKAVAKAKKMPFYQYVASLVGNANPNKFILPLPMVNVINGGEHADNNIDFQEFMFMPVGASSIHEAVRISSECFHALASLLKSKGLSTSKGDEGGFAPNLESAEDALKNMLLAIQKAGYQPGVLGGQVALALDCAATELYDKDEKVYRFKKAIAAGVVSEEEGTKTTEQMIEYYSALVDQFPIISIEDPLDESDWDGYVSINQKLGERIQIVGDDLYCTNPKITHQGVEKQLTNSVLIKVNQIGTLSETLKTIQIAKNAGWTCVLSHRSGETEDTSIADIAVGTSAGQIKTGSMSRSERIAKYNRLLEIEIELTAANSIFYGVYSLFSLDFNNTQLFKYTVYKVDEITGEIETEIVASSPTFSAPDLPHDVLEAKRNKNKQDDPTAIVEGLEENPEAVQTAEEGEVSVTEETVPSEEVAVESSSEESTENTPTEGEEEAAKTETPAE